MTTTVVGPISAKSGQLREDWQHSDGKAHTRLADSWDDLEGVTKLAMLSWDTGTLAWVKFTGVSGGTGGGGAATIADGADVAEGAKADATWSGAGAGSVIAILKAIWSKLNGTLTVSNGQLQPLTDTQLRATPVPVSNSSLPLPAGASTEATLALIKAKTDNLDVALSTRTKPGDTQPTSLADGSSVTLGSKADAAWDGAAAAPTSQSVWKYMAAKLDAIRVLLAGTLVTTTAQLPAALVGARLDVNIGASSATVPVSLATNAPDVTDRAGRLLGVIASITAAVDISDRAARLIGTVAQGTAAAIASAWPFKLTDGTNTAAIAAGGYQLVQQRGADTCVSGIGTANTIFTTTIGAAGAGLFHYITAIEIIRLNPTVTAVAAAAAVISITSTNLPGGLAWSIGNLIAAGAYDVPVRLTPNNPIKSSVANTATTIVCPAGGAGVQFRVNVYYYTGT